MEKVGQRSTSATKIDLRGLLLPDPDFAEETLRPWIWGVVPFAGIVGFLTHPDNVEIISGILLLITAGVCWRIFSLRRNGGQPILADQARIWLFIAAGFAFLTLDEALSIHEQTDFLIHRVLSIEETAVTDRLDDVIVLAYGLAGATLIILHRREFAGLSAALPFLAGGFLFLVLMVSIDAATNRDDLLAMLPFSRRLSLAEEVTKVIAEVLLLLGFLRMYRLLGPKHVQGLSEAEMVKKARAR